MNVQLKNVVQSNVGRNSFEIPAYCDGVRILVRVDCEGVEDFLGLSRPAVASDVDMSRVRVRLVNLLAGRTPAPGDVVQIDYND
jgi:hypothetical protein